ncbi:MAG: CcmD family protein [Melioribacteraceae bacterium]|nr:CcmD family protein [Melioribacteraceae bacterium]MCO6474208.1 CcmD family protein [Melioribacteraceae bacterium]
MFIVLIVWLGIFLYMMSAENRLKKIEAELKEIESNEK